MKRTTIIFLTCVGAFTLLVSARCIVGALSDENRLRKQFGSPKAIQALTEFYEHVEKDGATLKPAGAKSRPIPYGLIPSTEFWIGWEQLSRHKRIEAYFDDKGALIGIELVAEWGGCFISRDATRCPASFLSLYRLADKPLYVTAVVKDPE
jgi:hypothetical protein